MYAWHIFIALGVSIKSYVIVNSTRVVPLRKPLWDKPKHILYILTFLIYIFVPSFVKFF